MRFGKRSFWEAAAVGLLLLSGIPGSEGALKVSKDGSFLADKMSFAPRKNNTVKMIPDNNGVYQYVQTGKDPVLSCQLEPSDRLLLVDGKAINISQDFPRDKKDFFRNRKAESISIPLFWGRRLNITGNMRITLEDSRFYTEYSLGGAYLLEIKPEKKESRLVLSIRESAPVFTPIPLDSFVNGKLPESIKKIPAGKFSYQNFNNALSFLFPKKAGNALFPSGKVTIPFTQNEAKALVLLHGVDPEYKKVEIGTLAIVYQDGREEKFPIVAGKNAGPWKNCDPSSNFRLVWSSISDSDFHAFGMSQFPLKQGAVSLKLRTGENSRHWGILGISLLNSMIPDRDLPETFYVKEGKEWANFTFQKDIVKGSFLDFSGQNHAPAGKFGHMIANAKGQLSFEKEPSKRFRIVGANLCSGVCFPTKGEAKTIARRLATLGYNMVRFHRYDEALIRKNARTSTEIDMKQLDLLEYFVYELKKNGIYFTADIYCLRNTRPGDKIPEADLQQKSKAQMKTLLPLSDAAMENWKAFTKNWLTHRNPYTGLTWTEEPAFAFVQFLNENNIDHRWDDFSKLQSMYLLNFDPWLKANGIVPASHALTTDNPAFCAYLFHLQEKNIREQRDFLRNELKMKTLITDCNMETSSYPLAHFKARYFDLADAHGYFDHPKSKYGFGKGTHTMQLNPLKATFLPIVHDLSRARLYGKPVLSTEWKFCVPNRFRAYGGPIMGAYLALQDWDGLFQYSWAHARHIAIWNTGHSTFDSANDPLAHATDRITMLLFRRGDVSPAKEAVAYQVPADYRKASAQNPPMEVESFAALVRTGSVIEGTRVPGVTVLSDQEIRSRHPFPNKKLNALYDEMRTRGIARSATGEITHNIRRGTLSIITPRAEVFSLEKGAMKGKQIAVAETETPQTIAFFSMDGKTIAESRDLLIIHLTNSLNRNTRFDSPSMREQQPATSYRQQLIRIASPKVELKLDGPVTNLKITALASDGKELGPVSFTGRNGSFHFVLNNALYPDGVLYYRIQR